MKYKNIAESIHLNENNPTDKLKKKLNSGKWKNTKIPIYRGRKTDKKPVMVKETTGGREPTNTNSDVDRFCKYFS